VTGALTPARAQSPDSTGSALVHGYVRDSNRRPLANATVFLIHGTLEQAVAAPTETTHTDSKGHYQFAGLRAGTYTVRAEMIGYDDASAGPGNIASKETTQIDLFLASTKASELLRAPPAPAPTKPAAQAPEFFDEPQFTVAGITQATNSGGHGSDVVLRTSEALVKATGSLGTESPSKESTGNESSESVGAASLKQERAEIQALIRRDDNLHDDQAQRQQAERHHRLAQLDEKTGDPLAAVREYQRAAELDPSEPHLFDWASELLTHRALEPATEVFAQGNRRFPQSARMLIGLSVAWYARGSYERASQYLASASDLAPADPTPYLFMGKMQSVETAPSEESVERLARFQRLAPENALANYYYAVALWKQRQSAGALDDASSAQVEALLEKAVQLDPKLGAAYLQLGILYAQRGDYAHAISTYQKAVETSPELEEAHYRLAQAYRRTGKQAEAQKEMQVHEELAKKSKEEAERKRREIQQFVISLRDKGPDSQSPPQP